MRCLTGAPDFPAGCKSTAVRKEGRLGTSPACGNFLAVPWRNSRRGRLKSGGPSRAMEVRLLPGPLRLGRLRRPRPVPGSPRIRGATVDAPRSERGVCGFESHRIHFDTPAFARFTRKGLVAQLKHRAKRVLRRRVKCGERAGPRPERGVLGESNRGRPDDILAALGDIARSVRAPNKAGPVGALPVGRNILREGRRRRLACLISTQAPCNSESRYPRPG